MFLCHFEVDVVDDVAVDDDDDDVDVVVVACCCRIVAALNTERVSSPVQPRAYLGGQLLLEKRSQSQGGMDAMSRKENACL